MKAFLYISVLWLLCNLSYTGFSQEKHPLDPLDFQEYWKVLEALRKAGHLNDSTRFSMVNLIGKYRFPKLTSQNLLERAGRTMKTGTSKSTAKKVMI